MVYDEQPTWNAMSEDNMKFAFAIKGGVEYPREPFDEDQIVPTFVSVTTEYGVSKYQIIELKPCTSESFEGIDDISILQKNGFNSDSPIENLLCPFFGDPDAEEEESEEDAEPILDVADIGMLSDLTNPNANYLAFLVRAKAVNNTYMETVRVVGYASSTKIMPDNQEQPTKRYMR